MRDGFLVCFSRVVTGLFVAGVLAASLVANAQVVPLDEVPYDHPKIDAYEAAMLRSTEGRLRIRLRSLRRIGKIFNGQCTSVEVGTPQFATCQARFNQLSAYRNAYNGDAAGFNIMLDVALGTANLAQSGPGDPLARTRANVINARIIIHRGTIWRDNKESFGAPFAPGERVRTSEDAQVDIVFPNGDIIRVGPNSEFTFANPDAPAPGNFLNRLGDIILDRGRILSVIQSLKKASNRRPPSMRSNNAHSAVRGTKYEFAVEEDGATAVTVFEGVVEITLLRDGTVLEVGEYQRLIIGPDGTSAGVASIDPLAHDDWWY